MRFIPTTPDRIESLKKQAKRMHRAGRGKHAELLDRVARGAGYEHWHHVVVCLKQTSSVHNGRALPQEIEKIVSAALKGVSKAVVTGPEASASQPFVLFSTEDGDAWMLDPEADGALCLAWHGERQPVHVIDAADQLEIRWDGRFDLSGQFFAVETKHPGIGSRHIAGYPADQLRQLLEELRSADKRIESIFGRSDTVSLTESVIWQLVQVGWDETNVREAERQGAQYSPSRDSLLFPAMGNL